LVVGVPEMTPVAGLMLSPGGSPDAAKDCGDWVAVTVNEKGAPGEPVAAAGELTRGPIRYSRGKGSG
jgi:hypothetical protein